MIAPPLALAPGHLGDLGLGVGPGLLGRIAHEGGDAQAELQRRQVAVEIPAQRLQPLDPPAHAVQRLAPEQLHIGFRRRHPLGRLRGPAKIELGMAPIAPHLQARLDGRSGHLEMLAREGHVLLGPQPADQPHELLGAGIAVRLLALAVAIGGQVVLSRDDIHPNPAAAQVVQRGGCGREIGRAPIAGANGDQGLEGGRPGGQRSGDGEGVRTAPARAQQRPPPAMLFERLRVTGQGVKAVVALDRGIASMAGLNLVGDVPEEFGLDLLRAACDFGPIEGSDVSEPVRHLTLHKLRRR